MWNCHVLLAIGHSFYLFTESSPIICLKFGIFDSLLTPVLMQAADVVLAVLEVKKLVTNAFFDKDAASMLLHNRLLVLFQWINTLSLHVFKSIVSAHLKDGLLNFLNFSRLDGSLRTAPQILQFPLIGLNTFLELRNGVLCKPIPPIK